MTTEILDMIKKAADEAGCRYMENEPLCRYTTFGIGGRCPLMVEINSNEAAAELSALMKRNDVPFYVIGRGSNLLVSDNDIDMVFLHAGKDFSTITEENGIITCQAGAQLSAVAVFAKDKGLAGMEFAHGIPGNIGGAVFMNAGAYGGEMKDIVTEVTAADHDGNIRTFTADELDFSYRHSIFSSGGYIILSAKLKLVQGDRDEIAGKMAELVEKRRDKQPLEYRSAGSTFKRPQGTFAALLIEQCGLKGYSCGDAQVSEKHSGFVINKGSASFADVMNVIEHVRTVVHEQSGIMLECEPEIIE